MDDQAILRVHGEEVTLPTVMGTEAERGVDITRLRKQTGLITVDPGYGNTGACRSAIR